MNSSLSDEITVKNILAGDEKAFTQLYERYRLLIYTIAVRIIRDPGEAQDATQEIFLKLYRSLHRWDAQKSNLSTWISRITVNHSIDCYRTHFRRSETQLPENNPEFIYRLHTTGNPARSAFRAVQNREEISMVRRCIDKLPDIQKKTFISRYFHGLKLVEIAEMECRNLGTIKSSLHRATRAVRQVLLQSGHLSFSKMESPV